MTLKVYYREVLFPVYTSFNLKGWRIERPVEGLSVNEDSYEQNKSSVPRLTYDL